MAFAAAGGEAEDERVSKHSGERGYLDLPDYCWEAKGRLRRSTATRSPSRCCTRPCC
jgi:hypothetical protein